MIGGDERSKRSNGFWFNMDSRDWMSVRDYNADLYTNKEANMCRRISLPWKSVRFNANLKVFAPLTFLLNNPGRISPHVQTASSNKDEHSIFWNLNFWMWTRHQLFKRNKYDASCIFLIGGLKKVSSYRASGTGNQLFCLLSPNPKMSSINQLGNCQAIFPLNPPSQSDGRTVHKTEWITDLPKQKRNFCGSEPDGTHGITRNGSISRLNRELLFADLERLATDLFIQKQLNNAMYVCYMKSWTPSWRQS